MRRGPWHQVDEASLQTDVMRFMAIVAFCLIAILAMVRNVEPVPPQAVEQPPVVAQVATTSSAHPVSMQTETPQTTNPIPPQAPVTEQPSTPKPFQRPAPVVAVSKPERVEEPSVEPLVEPLVEPISEHTTQPIADPSPDTRSQTEQTTEEEGLTLRFSSESDFLRLVARGKVAVYAFDKSTFLALGSDYQFQQVSPPHQVYELEAATIPAHMSDALPKSSSHSQFKWAVELPQRVERQIQDYVATVNSGELLINKFEEVRHVPAG